MGPRVVGVQLNALDRAAGAGRVLLVTADQESVLLMPLVQWPEERLFGQCRAECVVVAPHLIRIRHRAAPESAKAVPEVVAVPATNSSAKSADQVGIEGSSSWNEPTTTVPNLSPSRRANSPCT